MLSKDLSQKRISYWLFCFNINSYWLISLLGSGIGSTIAAFYCDALRKSSHSNSAALINWYTCKEKMHDEAVLHW